jgi:hypothetical protein
MQKLAKFFVTIGVVDGGYQVGECKDRGPGLLAAFTAPNGDALTGC